jgi:hypothetical protein
LLTLRIPVAESAKPREVAITEGADNVTIEAQTTASTSSQLPALVLAIEAPGR